MKPQDYFRHAIQFAPLAGAVVVLLPDEWMKYAFSLLYGLCFLILRLWQESIRSDKTMDLVKELKTFNQAVKSVSITKDGTTIEFYESESRPAVRENKLTMVKKTN